MLPIHSHMQFVVLQPATRPAGLEDPEAAQPVEPPQLAKPLWTHPSGVLFALSPLDHFQVLQRRVPPTFSAVVLVPGSGHGHYYMRPLVILIA